MSRYAGGSTPRKPEVTAREAALTAGELTRAGMRQHHRPRGTTKPPQIVLGRARCRARRRDRVSPGALTSLGVAEPSRRGPVGEPWVPPRNEPRGPRAAWPQGGDEGTSYLRDSSRGDFLRRTTACATEAAWYRTGQGAGAAWASPCGARGLDGLDEPGASHGRDVRRRWHRPRSAFDDRARWRAACPCCRGPRR